jgi:tRNA1(Val) A37 N6-methylase TrmN6
VNLHLKYKDLAFVDLGTGRERALLLASRLPFKSVTGVEWSAELHRVAVENIKAYSGPRMSICSGIAAHGCWGAANNLLSL